MSVTVSLKFFAESPMLLCGRLLFRNIFLKDMDLFTENVQSCLQNTGICLSFRTDTDSRSLTENLPTSSIRLKTAYHLLNIYDNIFAYAISYIRVVTAPLSSAQLFFKINSIIFNMPYYPKIFFKTALFNLICNQ